MDTAPVSAANQRGIARLVATASPRERAHMVLLLLCIIGYAVHYMVWVWPQPWYIEDAAISFSYSRNLVDGYGLVPYPGGERVEGYSNALWTFLMAAFHAVWVDPWISSKIMGFVFGAATLPLSWLIARRATREDDGATPSHATVVPAVLLAASTQFVLWNDSGLENSLFCFLLSLGIWRLTVEIQDDRRAPWSALAFCGLAMTRPDGIAYVAIGLLARLVGTLRRRQWVALPLWILTFALPFAAYHAWRYEYFAWAFPNTYYAKVKEFKPFGWTVGGWKQFKEWAVNYWVAFAAPLPVLAVLGFDRWRKWLAITLLAVLALLTLWDGRQGIPNDWMLWWTPNVSRHWQEAIVWYLTGGGLLLGLLSLPGRGWEARAMLWASFCTGVFFWVYANGDWMKGYRWASQLIVPLLVLMGLGLGTLVERLPWSDRAIKGRVRVGTLLLAVLAGVIGGPNIYHSSALGVKPETSPNSVHRRVNYMAWVQRRLSLDRVTALDVDMGAHLWWSGWDMVDMAGLVDVPVAQHMSQSWPKEFAEDYVFQERRPEFAHVHGSWARTTKIPQNPRWKKEYVEIPGYPSGGTTLHVGNHVRKDLLAGPTYDIPEGRQARFASGVVLAGWRMPAPVVAKGSKLWLDTAWNGTKRADGFRVLVLFAPVKVEGEAPVFASDLAPGYDWYRPEAWSPNEFVWGRWSVPIPATLPEGTWELGFAVLDETTGAVLPFETTGNPAKDPGPGAPVRYLAGEFWSGGTFELTSPEAAAEAAGKAYERGLAEAADGRCEEAGESFANARRHVPRNESWYQARRADMDAAVVGCFVRRAEAEGDELARAKILVAARKVDFEDERLATACATLGASLEAHGDDARTAEDWETAYRYFAAAVAVDPSRSWARRKAEEARDWRLGLGVAKGKTGAAGKPKAPSKPPPAEVEDLEQRFGGAGE